MVRDPSRDNETSSTETETLSSCPRCDRLETRDAQVRHMRGKRRKEGKKGGGRTEGRERENGGRRKLTPTVISKSRRL